MLARRIRRSEEPFLAQKENGTFMTHAWNQFSLSFQPTQAKISVEWIHYFFVCCYLLKYPKSVFSSQINIKLKTHLCGKSSLSLLLILLGCRKSAERTQGLYTVCSSVTSIVMCNEDVVTPAMVRGL